MQLKQNETNEYYLGYYSLIRKSYSPGYFLSNKTRMYLLLQSCKVISTRQVLRVNK